MSDGVNGLPACGGDEPHVLPRSHEATCLYALEERLHYAFWAVFEEAEREGPLRRPLLELCARVQELQRRALAEARRR